MASSGYVLNGVYHRSKTVPMKKLAKRPQTMFKQSDHARQRFDHSAEILQPYDRNGEPNKQFIEAYPEAAVGYGFLPGTGDQAPQESNTPNPGDKGFGGSTSWEYLTSHRSPTK